MKKRRYEETEGRGGGLCEENAELTELFRSVKGGMNRDMKKGMQHESRNRMENGSGIEDNKLQSSESVLVAQI